MDGARSFQLLMNSCRLRVVLSHPKSPNDEDLSLWTPMPQKQVRGEGGAPRRKGLMQKRIPEEGTGGGLSC